MSKLPFLIASLVFICSSLQAEMKIWTGSTSNDWSEATNWSPNGTPINSDSLVVNSGGSVSNAQANFKYLQIEENASVTFGSIAHGTLEDKTIIVRGTLSHNGEGAFRFYSGMKIDLYGTLGSGTEVSWLDVKSSINFYDGASFGNEAMSFQHRGNSAEFGYKLSSQGFTMIKAGQLYKASPDDNWSLITYNVDISDYILKNNEGDVIPLLDYSGHADAYNGSFTPTINIVNNNNGLDAILTFDVVKSQLVLAVFTEGSTPPQVGPITTTVTTDGLSMTLVDAIPTVLQNAEGQNLLSGSQKGFYIMKDNVSRSFDKVTKNGDTYTFSMSDYPEQISVQFDGMNDFIEFNITDVSGFEIDGERLFFGLNTVGESVQTIALDYMTEAGSSRTSVNVERICLWEKSNPEKLGAFALYEYKDEQQEDEALLDIWTNTELAHPKVEGEWTKDVARQWLQDWIKMAYDVSYFNIEPESLEQHYDYIKYAKMMDAKAIYLWNGIWREEYWLNYRQNDEINPVMYPNGLTDVQEFQDTLGKYGMNMMFHYLCGNIGEHDPEFVYPNVSDGLHTWGTVSLVNAVSAGSTSILVRPDSGVIIPTIISDHRTYRPEHLPHFYEFKTFRLGDEWISATDVIDNGDGTYTFNGVNRGKWSTTAAAHSANATLTGYLRTYNQDFVPDPAKPLFDTITSRWANLNNSLGLIRASFDGYENHAGNGKWGNYKFSESVYRKLDHPTSANSSGGAAPRDWIEYRFNVVQDSMNGVFETRQTLAMLEGDKSRITPGIEESELKLYKSAMVNTRGFSVGSYDVKGVKLPIIEAYGLAENTFKLVKRWKDFSLPLKEADRASLNTSFSYNFDGRGAFNGNHPRWNALWRIEGGELRKWYSLGTDIYTHSWHSGQEHGTITPRIYVKNGQEQALDVTSELNSGAQKVRIIGRVLTKVEEFSAGNIDLMTYLGATSKNVTLTNSSSSAQWSLDNLQHHSISGYLDLSNNRALGLWVTGDNSGATLAIRLHTPGQARDYVVPINFSGKKWIELPSGEQGWRIRNWGFTPSAMKYFDYTRVNGISIGIGHIPGAKTTNITIEGLCGLKEENKALENPTISLGEQSINVIGSIPSESHFILDFNGDFTVYDEMWQVISKQKLPRLLPADLSTFKMESNTSSKEIWLEVGVQVSNESIVISNDFTSNSTPYEWLDDYELVSDNDYEKADTSDTDNDGWLNYEEFQNETDPLVANPMFLTSPLLADTAYVYNDFSYSIADKAQGPENVELLFSKVSGSEWLTINEDGTLTGMPTPSDIGSNVFEVKVAIDGAGSHTVSMSIMVEDVLSVIIENVSDGTSDWDLPSLLSPSMYDYADVHQHNGVTITNTVGLLNSAGGDVNVLIDGEAQSNSTDFKKSAIFLSARPSRYLMDLQSIVPIDSIVTYSWYREKFWSDQDYDLYYYSGDNAPDATMIDLSDSEWKKLISIKSDLDGQIATCITSKLPKELIKASHLLWDIKSGTAYGEFDIFVTGYEPKPASLNQSLSADNIKIFYTNHHIVIEGENIASYKIFNLLGQPLLYGESNSDITRIPFDNCGVYIVYTTNNKGVNASSKISVY